LNNFIASYIQKDNENEYNSTLIDMSALSFLFKTSRRDIVPKIGFDPKGELSFEAIASSGGP